ncbi:MAG: ComF family protein [Salibacteraceae bacterium]
MLADFISLIYPRLCVGCGQALLRHEPSVCTICRYSLPRTRFHGDPENPVNKLFWGKVAIERATAGYHFRKGSKVQRLIHQLKYKDRPEVGRTLGLFLGEDLKKDAHFSTVDLVIPVPLHPRKKRKRGYNQSDFIAEGMADGLGIVSENQLLYRAIANTSQTRKGHYERWQNVASIFKINEKKAVDHKHFLLVDDVVTTGSTLESCAATLLSLPDCKVSIATLAVTD